MAGLFRDCIDCEGRVFKCHSTCETYNKDKQIKDGIRTQKNKEQMYSIIPARDRKLPRV